MLILCSEVKVKVLVFITFQNNVNFIDHEPLYIKFFFKYKPGLSNIDKSKYDMTDEVFKACSVKVK